MTRTISKAILAILAVISLGACGEEDENSAAGSVASGSARSETLPKLGLMTSLPLYWSLEADLDELASGAAQVPWQRVTLEKAYRLEPLDTLSPIAALNKDEDPVHPLADLDQLAVIQPRGLSPSDNVALDKWVRAGGKLLLVLDPALSGEYELPLGDPRRPVGSALIPPVLKRWGLAMTFDERQALEPVEVALGDRPILLELFGTLSIGEADPQATIPDCKLSAGDAIAQCNLEQGRITVVADAALFEFPVVAQEGEKPLTEGQDPLLQLVQYAFE